MIDVLPALGNYLGSEKSTVVGSKQSFYAENKVQSSTGIASVKWVTFFT